MPTGNPPLIAVVDDDTTLRLSLVDLLRSCHYDTVAFASAEYYLAGAACVDCLIADIQMPGMSGIELKYRLIEDGRDCPTILITASSDSSLDEAARDCGAIALFRKPFSTESLIECIDRATQKGTGPG